ncbi:MAG: hypothetical protein ACOVP2_12370, partial [Armatimonadaceae bacterium]
GRTAVSARGYDDIAVFGFPRSTAGPASVVDQRFTNYIAKLSCAGGHRGPPSRGGFLSQTNCINGTFKVGRYRPFQSAEIGTA